MRMLEREGFTFDRYVDIFDGGPTMTAATDQIRTIREARDCVLADVTDSGETGQHAMLAAGKLQSFCATYGYLHLDADGTGSLDRQSVAAMGLKPGDHFLAMSR